MFHVDDDVESPAGAAGGGLVIGGGLSRPTKSSANLSTAGGIARATADPVCALACSPKCLLVARESGTVQRYDLPSVALVCKYKVSGSPWTMAINCDSTRLASIDHDRTLTLYDLEAAAGIPNVLHSGGRCPAPPRTVARPGPLGGDIEYAVGLYLVVAGPGTTISISNDWYDADFCWRPDWDVDFGAPLGNATRTSTYTWVRNYTRSNVACDVAASACSVDLLA